MKFNYTAVEGYKTGLQKTFMKIQESLEDFEKNCDNMTYVSNWNSKTRDYYYDMYNDILETFDNVNNKMINIKMYLEEVINNYKNLENKMNAAFGSTSSK